MASWLSALARTRHVVSGALRRVLGRPRVDAATAEELEELLVRADVEAVLAAEIVRTLEHADGAASGSRKDALAGLLARRLPARSFEWKTGHPPLSILVVGVNGSGKTTTCAKLAWCARRAGVRPLLCAGDTFRAAGSDQLRLWAHRVGCEVVSGAAGADAAAVAYDALDAAVARGADTVIIDTAGRMHTRQPLMEELKKVRRAMQKRRPTAPDETWIVLDAALGRNALSQARLFHDAVPLSGVIVSKLDGSAKAGFVFSIARELGLPVLFAGLGEGEEDLVPFQPDAFVKALLGLDQEDHEGE